LCQATPHAVCLSSMTGCQRVRACCTVGVHVSSVQSCYPTVLDKCYTQADAIEALALSVMTPRLSKHEHHSELIHTSCTPAQTLLQSPAAYGRSASPCSCSPPPHPSALPSAGEALADTSAASGPPHSPCAGSRPVQQQTSICSAIHQ